jgi:hypothetical protein
MPTYAVIYMPLQVLPSEVNGGNIHVTELGAGDPLSSRRVEDFTYLASRVKTTRPPQRQVRYSLLFFILSGEIR